MIYVTKTRWLVRLSEKHRKNTTAMQLCTTINPSEFERIE